ncbi:MAG: DUF2989 domain-containing protein [Thalassotalea sp.]
MRLKLMSAVVSIPLLASCFNQVPTVNELCEIHTQVCDKFVADSWCKTERKHILYAYHDLAQADIDINKYKLLINLEKYQDCMTYASKIEHIKLKEKRTFRLQNKEKASQTIEQLSQETANSTNPYILYFHWSRYLNEKALKKFIALEGTEELESPELQFFLATYYTKIDPKKTLGLLYRALELYQPDDKLNVEIFKSLITIFTKKAEYKQAYIWLKVLNIYHPEEEELSEDSLTNFQQLHRLNGSFLDKVAESTLDKISQGEFKSPKF